MLEFLRNLFESNFMPHGMCYQWQPEIVWLHAFSDGLIALSYYTIPFALIYFVVKRRDLAYRWMFVLFGAFIMACGTTHLLEIWTIWNGTYRLTGTVKLLTGVVSAGTAIVLVPLVPRALKLPSPQMLREANEALEREVEERKKAEVQLREQARQLDAANRRLKESERVKDEFFANVSHELRTPLTLILSPLEALLAGDYGELDDEQRQVHKTMYNNAGRLFQMVTGILDFSRLEADKVQVEREVTDVMAFSERILEDFQPTMQQKAIEGIFVARPQRATVQVDRYLYERILFNLLSNAVKFTPEGGKVTVSLEAEGDHLRVAVADTGIGIDEDELPHLFDKFRQVEGSATRRYEGTGLGLSLVKEFSEMMDGSVEVESTPGEGTVFTVHLVTPQVEQQEDADAAATPSRGRAYAPVARPLEEVAGAEDESRPLVLIVEDNRELVTHIADLLADHARLRVATNGREALERIRPDPPDLIISDIMMPEMDGFELCSTVKDDPRTAHIPVVLLTALTDRNHLLEGWEAGADEYIYKPFHPRELTTRVTSMLRAVMERKQSEAELQASEARYRSLIDDVIDSIAVGLFILDSDFQVVWVNEALTRFFGMKRDQLVGVDKRRLVRERMRPIFDEPDAFVETVLATYDDNSYTQQFECHVLEGDGRAERWLEHWSSPIRTGFYAGGRMELYTDITALKRAAHEVEVANRTLERRNRELQDFAYVASHDLQEPLRKIGAFSDLLEEDYGATLDEEGCYFLSRIRDSAERMAGLLDALLAYSRVTTRGRPFQPVDLNEIAESVLSDLELALDDAGATVKMGALPTVEGDPVQLRQLLQNLVANAIKYQREDADPIITVRGSIERGDALLAGGEEEVCRLEVEDNGIGFEVSYAERIFEPFERLHGRTTYEGTGMGLAICRRIVERHGGTIDAFSMPGEGSTFVVALPLGHHGESEVAAERLAQEAGRPGG